METNSSTPETNKPEKEVRQAAVSFWESLRAFFRQILDLRPGLDRAGTVESIMKNKKMEGANAWLLICSIMIASIGLDQNSQAVIIGAMLISPLMSPILGVGLAIGINDRKSLFLAGRHLLIAVGIALLTSVVYFFLTPFGQFTEQMEARTAPTLLDVLIAFFGGVAGIVSGSRKDQSNAIPGVAIATALMPPLCVAGYGIANFNWPIFLNAFYLFFLNSVFVAFATYIFVRYLRFPYKVHQSPSARRKAENYILLFVLLTLIPSLYILYNVWEEVLYKQRAKNFVKEYFQTENQNAYKWENYKVNDTTNVLLISLWGKYIDEDSLYKYNDGIEKYKLGNTRLKLNQVDLPAPQDLDKLSHDIRQDVLEQVEASQKEKNAKDIEIENLQFKIDSLKNQFDFSKVKKDLHNMYPELEQIGLGMMNQSDFKEENKSPVLLIKWKRRTKNISDKEMRIKAYIQSSCTLDTLTVLKY